MSKMQIGREHGLPGDSIPLPQESIGEEATRVVNGPRGNNYGPPFENFERTGKMWAAILRIPEVTPEQVGLCMIALKLDREATKPSRDNRVDIAGYAETLQKVAESRNGR